jgi:hypothetical protein
LLKLLLTAFHHPSILVTRFFFRRNCGSVLDLVDPPEDCRVALSCPMWVAVRSCPNARRCEALPSIADVLDRTDRLRRAPPNDSEFEWDSDDVDCESDPPSSRVALKVEGCPPSLEVAATLGKPSNLDPSRSVAGDWRVLTGADCAACWSKAAFFSARIFSALYDL